MSKKTLTNLEYTSACAILDAKMKALGWGTGNHPDSAVDTLTKKLQEEELSDLEEVALNLAKELQNQEFWEE